MSGPKRTCSRCHEPKPLDAFRLDSRGYRRSHCGPCALAVTQDYRARHRDRLLTERRVRYAARRDGPGGEKKESAVSDAACVPRVPTPGTPGGVPHGRFDLANNRASPFHVHGRIRDFLSGGETP